MYYYQSSQLTVEKRMKDALLQLFIWTIVPGMAGVVAWIYLFFNKKLTIKTTPQFVIALTNA